MKTSIDMRALARIGALARIAELETELSSLRQMFADRELPSVGTDRKPIAVATIHIHKRRSYRMTPAQRRAVGVRMRKYWRQRRAAK